MTGDLAPTRASLHALAEHVLCAARYQAIGRIGLQVVPGGFATQPFDDDRRVAVIGTDVVVRADAAERRARITTLRAAASLAGIEPGAPAQVFTPTTDIDPDATLEVDPRWASRLMAWYALGDEALRRFAAEIAVDEPSAITLWPEHFDVAIRAADISYGASPGDDGNAEPYLYVGPDAIPAGGEDFWDQPFGAARPWTDVHTVADAVAFFAEGRRRAAAATRPG